MRSFYALGGWPLLGVDGLTHGLGPDTSGQRGVGSVVVQTAGRSLTFVQAGRPVYPVVSGTPELTASLAVPRDPPGLGSSSRPIAPTTLGRDAFLTIGGSTPGLGAQSASRGSPGAGKRVLDTVTAGRTEPPVAEGGTEDPTSRSRTGAFEARAVVSVTTSTGKTNPPRSG